MTEVQRTLQMMEERSLRRAFAGRRLWRSILLVLPLCLFFAFAFIMNRQYKGLVLVQAVWMFQMWRCRQAYRAVSEI